MEAFLPGGFNPSAETKRRHKRTRCRGSVVIKTEEQSMINEPLQFIIQSRSQQLAMKPAKKTTKETSNKNLRSGMETSTKKTNEHGGLLTCDDSVKLRGWKATNWTREEPESSELLALDPQLMEEQETAPEQVSSCCLKQSGGCGTPTDPDVWVSGCLGSEGSSGPD